MHKGGRREDTGNLSDAVNNWSLTAVLRKSGHLAYLLRMTNYGSKATCKIRLAENVTR